MASLIVGGVTIKVAPGGVQRERLDGTDRARAFDNTYRASVTGTPKRDWMFSTPPIHRNDADLYEGILATVAAQVCSGDILGGSQNLALWSEAADNAAWTKTNTTVSANVSQAPDGLGTMDALTETAVNAIHSLRGSYTAVAGQSYTLSLYVRPNGRGKASLVIESAPGFQQVFFDVPNLTITSNTSGGGGALGTPSIRDVGGGRYRISLTGTAFASGVNVYEFRLLDAAGAQSYLGTGLDMHVWGMQFNEGALQSYVKTTTAAVTLPVINCFSEILGWTPVKTGTGHAVVLDFALHEA